jgi:hypothetical protein
MFKMKCVFHERRGNVGDQFLAVARLVVHEKRGLSGHVRLKR